ncbi:MAG: aspartyl-phosphate phosphatase Spo0E family protein [Tissierellaceae bacterium]|jgi:hypothetical protein|nr:Spo0E family sporulation regulatory protein-aspartic acid phosphatase [Tissierellia bacterium]
MLDKINQLKKQLDDLMGKEEKDQKKILDISRELDVLIVEYYKSLEVHELVKE